MSSHQTKNRAAVVLLAVALGLAGVRGAAAAGVNVLGQSLGAGSGGVGQCSSQGIDVNYGVGYAEKVGGFAVTSVTLSGISGACIGRHVAVALTGSDGKPMASVSTQVTGAETTMNVPETSTVAAEQLGGVSIVITD
jgi:hypothetical protein